MKWFANFQNYKKEYLSGDLSAGITVGIMLIPQGMAYAMIAGLPPIYGLYAAIFPQVFYAILGTSRLASVGPVALDSLIIAVGVKAMNPASESEYIALALLLSFLMGAFQFVFGLLRMGFLVHFLSKPVISGFTVGAGVIIILSQLQNFTGLKLPQSNTIQELLMNVYQSQGQMNGWALLIGLLSVGILFVLQRFKKIPAALVLIVLFTSLVYVFKDQVHVPIVKDIPAGFASLNFDMPFHLINKDFMIVAITLSLIAFMESYSVSVALQEKFPTEGKMLPNQEFLALGMGNLLGSLFGSYGATGGFSRSAVHADSGAKSGYASILSALIVVVTLLFFTPLFYYLPKAVLGAIIFMAMIKVFDWSYYRYLYQTNKNELGILVLTFILTITTSIQTSILLGVVLSLLLLIYKTSRPHVAILGNIPNTTDYRNTKRLVQVITRPDVVVLRYDAQLFFANVSHFQDSVMQALAEKDGAKLLVLHFGSVHEVDSTALLALQSIVNQLKTKGVKVMFTGLIGPVRDFFRETGFIEKVGKDHFFVHIHSAIQYFDTGDKEKWQKEMDQVTELT